MLREVGMGGRFGKRPLLVLANGEPLTPLTILTSFGTRMVQVRRSQLQIKTLVDMIS